MDSSDGKVISFETHLKARQNKQRLKNELTRKMDQSGWTLAGDLGDLGDLGDAGSDVCVYLLDSEEDAALVFGSKATEFDSQAQGSWHDLINAWDVVADPDLPCDGEHLHVTAELARRAIALTGLLPDSSTVPAGQRVHLIMVIDRDDFEQPLASVVAISNAPIMDAVSVRAVLERWVEES
ncbi:MAG: hypothetical protein V7752_20720 [Halopseudomonas sp.]